MSKKKKDAPDATPEATRETTAETLSHEPDVVTLADLARAAEPETGPLEVTVPELRNKKLWLRRMDAGALSRVSQFHYTAKESNLPIESNEFQEGYCLILVTCCAVDRQGMRIFDTKEGARLLKQNPTVLFSLGAKCHDFNRDILIDEAADKDGDPTQLSDAKKN